MNRLPYHGVCFQFMNLSTSLIRLVCSPKYFVGAALRAGTKDE